jgi:pilus assembly protein CpaF
VADLIRFGSFDERFVTLLKACIQGRLNIIISGGTGSGKTTTLNILSSFLPSDERIVTIEDAAELQLRQEHVVRLESRPSNIEGKGLVSIRNLVTNCLRMRPDRIVVGEVRSGEALDMLQAMNTGHDGSLTTLHSNGPRDTLRRLETMVLMAGMDLPLRAIREQIASALNLIIHQERMRDGSRRITYVTEVQGMEGDVIVMQDIFSFVQTGISDGRIIGSLEPTGVRPKFSTRLEDAGATLPAEIFQQTTSRPARARH